MCSLFVFHVNCNAVRTHRQNDSDKYKSFADTALAKAEAKVPVEIQVLRESANESPLKLAWRLAWQLGLRAAKM